MALTKAQQREYERNQQYWRKREEEALKHYITDEKEYEKELKRIYKNMQDNVQNEINAFYGRYADKEDVTIATAKRRVKKADIEAFERKAKRYVKDKDFSAKANEEMRLYNLMMKVNRLEMLKANIGLELIAGHDELAKYMEKILKGRTEEELKRQAGILGKTIRDNAKTANAIVNASFHNATFSDRVWMYQDLMRDDLDKLLQSGLIQGKNPRVLARDIKKYFVGADGKGGATFAAERLMRTELARVQTEAQKQSFEKNGFGKYMFIVNAGCCPICEEIAKTKTKYGVGVYLVSEMAPGKNAAPVHPHCRCSTAAYEDSAEYEKWLAGLKGEEKTEEPKKVASQATTKPKKRATIQPEEFDIEGNTKKLKAAMDEKNYKEFIDLVKNNSVQGVKKLYAHYGDLINGIRRKANGGVYNPTVNTVEFDYSTKHEGIHKFSTLAHEMGHYFDAKANYKGLEFKEFELVNEKCQFGSGAFKFLRQKACFSDNFLAAIDVDKDLLAGQVQDLEFKRTLAKNHGSAGVQDAIDGMFGIRIGWGHGDRYYNRQYSKAKQLGIEKQLQAAYKELGFDASNQAKTKRLARRYDTASEVWANVSSAIVCGGEELKWVQQCLPNSYEAILKILEGVD